MKEQMLILESKPFIEKLLHLKKTDFVKKINIPQVDCSLVFLVGTSN